jgi:hypothetical protein
MTDRPTTDDALIAWLQRGSQGAPAGLLADVVEQVSHTRQEQSPLVRFWAGGPSAALVPGVVLVAAVVGLLAVGLTVLQPRPTIGPAAPSATPSPATTTASPSLTPSPTLATFDRPFTWRLDPAWGMTLTTATNAYQFRTDDRADPSYHPTGVNVRAYGATKTGDWCHPGGEMVSMPTAQQVVDAIGAMPGLEVSDVTHTTIDGRDALEITVRFRTAAECPDIYLFEGPIAFNGGTSVGQFRRMAVFDVDGETVSVASFADRGQAAADAFFPIADAFIETLHFDAPAPTPRASP